MKAEYPDFSHIRQLFQSSEAAFQAFYSLLIEYNGRYNLTAITAWEEVVHKHFYDSLAGAHLFPANSCVVEIGSGAGFPSIPLKIVRPDLQMTLIESTGKKCAFLETAVSALGLKGVKVLHARAEELGRDGAHRERYDAAVARAVAPLPALAEYCLPFVRVGGRMIAYKGATDELAEGRRALETLGGKGCSVRYELPEGYGERTLVITEKVRHTPAKYPRGHGKERTAPIV